MLKNFIRKIQRQSLDGVTDNASLASGEASGSNGLDGNVLDTTQTESADKIKKFMQKFLAAQCYGNMFSTGSSYATLGTSLPPANQHVAVSGMSNASKKHTFAALDHLAMVSAANLASIRGKVSNLTVSEEGFVEKVEQQKWHFRHQTNSLLETKKEGRKQVDISSNDKLTADGVKVSTNTYSEDRDAVSNQDFVFFGVEFSNDSRSMPMNHRHNEMDFGANSILIDDENEQSLLGYLTLTDHFYHHVPFFPLTDHPEFTRKFPRARCLVGRSVHGDKATIDIPIYSTKDMKTALALHAIDFMRVCKDSALQDFMLDPNLTDINLDNVLNALFQCEFHIPRLLSARKYTAQRLRAMSLKEAVAACNYKELDALTTTKNKALVAIAWAFKLKKPEVELHLTRRWQMSAADLPTIQAHLARI